MANRFGLPFFKKGDAVSAAKLNKIVEVIQRIAITAPSPGTSNGLEMSQDAGGTTLRVAFPATGLLALSSGTITARSGSTAGTGTVTLQTTDSSGNITSTSINLDVLNWNSATGGIASGKYCWIGQDENRNWYVISAEC